jgi:hypothetical protein
MGFIGRRRFLSLISGSAAGIASLPLLPKHFALANTSASPTTARSCWLDLAAPLIIEDVDRGLHTEIVLTSDTFIGSRGYHDGFDATEYELYLYDASGAHVNTTGPTTKLKVAAMQTTVVPVRDLIPKGKNYWGGLRVRLRPVTREPTHASDLFSSAFVRWQTNESFTTVHANPDPLEWQRPDSFFYSMPFPLLDEYDCVYSLFNPYDQSSTGTVSLYDSFGRTLTQLPYDLKPHSSLLVDLRTGRFVNNPNEVFSSRDKEPAMRAGTNGGTIAVTNRPGSVKNFGYMLIKQAEAPRFSIEHPIHQPPYNPRAASVPFDKQGRFKAKNVLYTPLVFNAKKIGDITLQSRFHLSSGAPIEEALWLSPFITDERGDVVWQAGNESKFPTSLSKQQIERGAIKLPGQQSCVFDCSTLGLPQQFSGGLSLAITPLTNHTLMKVETMVVEWNATAFTHFRPGLAAARAYQTPAMRGGLHTDYIVSGARLTVENGRKIRDEIVAVINIDDQAISGNPTLEVFSSTGLVTRVKLGPLPPFSCHHYLLSSLLSEKTGAHDLSLRLVDDQTTLLMSVLHLDYQRRDIAADHGSDRFSTFAEFSCDGRT